MHANFTRKRAFFLTKSFFSMGDDHFKSYVCVSFISLLKAG